MPLAYPPLPFDRGVKYGRPGYRDYQFKLPDGEGMFPRPPGYHGAVDWFADGGAPVVAARGGTIVEVTPSRGNTGQVFGGTVKVAEPDGTIWVYRHIDPYAKVGEVVDAGDKVGFVTRWVGGPSHLHMEIWKTLSGGYNISNAIDPKDYTYTVVYRGESPPLTLKQRLMAAWFGGKSADVVIEKLKQGYQGDIPNPTDHQLFLALRREGFGATSARRIVKATRRKRK